MKLWIIEWERIIVNGGIDETSRRERFSLFCDPRPLPLVVTDIKYRFKIVYGPFINDTKVVTFIFLFHILKG